MLASGLPCDIAYLLKKTLRECSLGGGDKFELRSHTVLYGITCLICIKIGDCLVDSY